MIRLALFLMITFITFFFPAEIFAQNIERYVTVVNPVRSRDKWTNIASVENQIKLLLDLQIPATWLLQYSVLIDPAAVNIFKDLPNTQEKGVFLEIDENLATSALVPYKLGVGDWARADKVLPSGYTPQERKRMIDKLFAKFKQVFGRYPTSVGAWYIDTVSLNYMSEKYNIEGVLDVSDQYQTDTYGVWGKPWGTPYYPNKVNSLIPAQTLDDRLEVVKIQWAPRDPVRGYGLTVFDSTYSIQVNDYQGHNLNILYFKDIISEYLFSDNPISQATVGLEVGQEGAKFFKEYKEQLELLKKWEKEGKLEFINMKRFAERFKEYYSTSNPNFIISGSDVENKETKALWYSTPFYRIGLLLKDNKLILRDLRIYSLPYISQDFINKDEEKSLKRIIPALISKEKTREEKVLFNDISKITTEHKNNEMELEIITKDRERHLLRFNSQKVLIDEKEWFNKDKYVYRFDSLASNIASKLINYQIERRHNWDRSIRFSKINGVYYFGITLSPGKFLGFKSVFPFLVTENFPFQVLSHFQTFPNISPFSFLGNCFINYLNNSTIKVISQMNL